MEDDNMKIYKEVLQTKLKRARLSQAKLAKLAGITPNTISGWNKGNDARRTAIEKVASVLKCTVDELTSPPAADQSKSISVDLDLELVAHHYGVSVDDIITLAPVLFNVVAQKAVRNQRKRVENWYTQAKEAVSVMPFDLVPDWVTDLEDLSSDIEDTYFHALKGAKKYNIKTIQNTFSSSSEPPKDAFFEALDQIDEDEGRHTFGFFLVNMDPASNRRTLERSRIGTIIPDISDETLDEITKSDHDDRELASNAREMIVEGFSLRDVPQGLWKDGKGFERAKFIASDGGKKKLPEGIKEFVTPQGAQDFNEINPNGGDNA
jgi:transcriptional regulator with XRE-family HTH domain